MCNILCIGITGKVTGMIIVVVLYYILLYLVIAYQYIITCQVTEVYKDFPTAEAPMICSMGISCEIPLVDSALGKVQAGSPLSYQQPATVKRNLSFNAAPPRPSVPLQVTAYSHPVACCLY